MATTSAARPQNAPKTAAYNGVPDHATLQQELLRAAASGDVAYLNQLLEYDFDRSVVDAKGSSALFLVTEAQHLEAVVALLHKGLSPNLANHKGFVPLHAACKHRNVTIVRELIRYKADLDVEVPFVGTPAMVAARAGFDDVLSILMQAKADADVATSGETVLSVCSELNEVEMVETIVRRGANLELEDLNGYTSLMRACKKGHTDVVRVLLSGKADPNHLSAEGTTAVYLADFMGHADCVNLLQQFGAVRACVPPCVLPCVPPCVLPCVPPCVPPCMHASLRARS
jgi:ankyrin repeat protein